nr:MAG TPA_asm: hypothetical protein [Caudoviricetes sp.]
MHKPERCGAELHLRFCSILEGLILNMRSE